MPGSPLDVRIHPDTLRSRDSSTFSGSYQTLGTPLPYNSRLIKFTNNSNQSVTISWDGINDHEFVPSNSFVLLDISTNRETANHFDVPANTQFYVKGTAGVGSIYLSV